jgi:hypothetical protein
MKHAVPRPSAWLFVAAASLVSAPVAHAQLLGGTDHFECYNAEEVSLEEPIEATLEDQFGERADVLVHNISWFCNPAAKTVDEETTGIDEEQNHLALYPISRKSPEPRRIVTIENQFGTQIINVTAPRLLAVPTQKAPFGPPAGISHFLCYEATGRALNVEATLEDQFEDAAPDAVRVLSVRFLCNPASKTIDEVTTAPEADEDHLACYKISPSRQPSVDFVDISNQIDEEDSLMIGPSQFLCVPSEKTNVVSLPNRVAPRPTIGGTSLEPME